MDLRKEERKLGRYILRRILTVIPVFFGISILVFSFIRLIPGDPAVAILGEKATEASIALVRANLGLDRPIYEQDPDLHFAGASRRPREFRSTRRAGGREIVRLFPATVELALSAILFSLLIGIPVVVVSAIRRNSFYDNASRVIALAGVSMPVFWLGLMLAWGFGVILHGSDWRTNVDRVVRVQTNNRPSPCWIV